MAKFAAQKYLVAFMAVSALTQTALLAEVPGRHPGYMRAIADLRLARDLINRPDFSNVDREEMAAVSEIDACINDLYKASITDGKDVNRPTGSDLGFDIKGRMHKALDALKKAHSDMDKEEDDPYTRGLQHRAVEHVDRAMDHVKRAMHDKFKDIF